MRFRWPRGRWNGKRIIGFSLKLRVSTYWWGFIPHWPKYAGCSWLWFVFWIDAEYER